MHVLVVAASATDETVDSVVRLLRGFCEDIHIIDPVCYLQNFTQTKHLVKVIVANEPLLEIIRNLKESEVQTLFQKQDAVVIIVTDVSECSNDELARLSETGLKSWTYSVDKLDEAMTVIRKETLHVTDGSFSQRYFIHPTSVSQLYEEEVMIVLNETLNPNVEHVTVCVHGTQLTASKKQTNVWVFNVTGVEPGVKIVQVFADDEDLGPNTLTILNTMETTKQALASLRKTDARVFLADILCLNINDFDLDLADILAGSSCMTLVESILKYGDQDGYDYPTLLHLCAKYGLSRTVDLCRRTGLCKNRFYTKDKTGKTAEQVAKEEQPNETFYQSFQDDGTEMEDFDTRPPTSRWSDPTRTSSIDSGRSSSGSFGAQSSVRKAGTVRKRLPSDPGTPISMQESARPYDFTTRRVERPYEEIADIDSQPTFYSEPWRDSQLATNIQTLTTFPENMKDANITEESMSTKF